MDNVEDCAHASDERMLPGDPCLGYQCKDNTCIYLAWLNDGIPDCPHADDEDDFVRHKSVDKMKGYHRWSCSGTDTAQKSQ